MDTEKEMAKYTEEYITITLTFDESERTSEVRVINNTSGRLCEAPYKYHNLDSARLKFLERVTTYIRNC